MPVYAGGRRRGELRAADAEVAQAFANARSVLDSVALEVTVAYRGVDAAKARIDLARPAVAEATENLRLVSVKYRNGNATPTDIADAEATLTRLDQRFFSTRYDYLLALARLDYALGRPQGSFVEVVHKHPGKGAPPAEAVLPAGRSAPEMR
jgi:outer membrane protein TolC